MTGISLAWEIYSSMSSLDATDWQKEIYLNGFAGIRSSVPVAWPELENKARLNMSPESWAYMAGGAGMENTMKANRAALDQLEIIPRMLRDVSSRNTGIELFGVKLPAPLLMAPVGVLDLAYPEGDLAVGKAAADLGIPLIFSNQAGVPMEKVAAAMGKGPRWFQLYWSKSNDLVASFVSRAELCGCSAIVLTLDTTMLGWRPRDLDEAYLPFLQGKGIAQYTSDPVFQRLMDDDVKSEPIRRKVTVQSLQGLVQMARNYPGSGFISKLTSGRPVKAVRKFVSIYSNPALNWDDLKFLRSHTRLPVLLKGILHPDDARKAVSYGVDGVIVSNHGGRQVDGSAGAATMLPRVVDAVNGKMPVLFDSGIRSGADVFKALALGAAAVCVGRPYVYGLAIGGQQGVYHVMRNLISEFELTMGLAGCTNVSEISREWLV